MRHTFSLYLTEVIFKFAIVGLIRALFPQLTYVSALAISACLTPTDPVLASTIVGGKFASTHVPLHVRQLLSAESAANDGLAYPFLSLSVYLTLESSVSTAFEKFFLVGVLCKPDTQYLSWLALLILLE